VVPRRITGKGHRNHRRPWIKASTTPAIFELAHSIERRICHLVGASFAPKKGLQKGQPRVLTSGTIP
jgi:hypothetical protein